MTAVETVIEPLKVAPPTPFLSDVPPAKYIKQSLIGSGAYGEAWLVRRAADGETFVAKVMKLSQMPENQRQYALAEIRCLRNCDHPNIINYIEDSGTEGEDIVIVTEFADACDLASQMRGGEVVFSEREAGILFAQLILAIHHVHRRRIIHRDIKSSNIFLTTCGLVKLGDFGFSKQYDQTVSGSVAGTFLGTPYYVSPEMWRGKRYGKKTDVWAAGVVLYETLDAAHRRPFQGNDRESLRHAVLQSDLEPIPNVSREMMDLVAAALSPSLDERPTTVQLLGMPLMQHYTTMFHTIVLRDPNIPAHMKARISAAISDAYEDVKSEKHLTDDGNDPRFESAVKKETDGAWKDRVLILHPPMLVLTLAHGKEAAPGTDRSKRIQLDQIMSVVGTDSDGRHHKFAIELNNGNVIVLSVVSEQLRETWLAKLHTALGM